MIGVGPVEHTTEVVAEGGKIKSYTSTMLAAEQQRVGAAAKAFQASASLPNTGAGPQPSQSSSFLFGIGLDLTTLLVGLMAIGLLSLGGLFLVRRTNSQAR
jgi:hypothetical protein